MYIPTPAPTPVAPSGPLPEASDTDSGWLTQAAADYVEPPTVQWGSANSYAYTDSKPSAPDPGLQAKAISLLSTFSPFGAAQKTPAQTVVAATTSGGDRAPVAVKTTSDAVKVAQANNPSGTATQTRQAAAQIFQAAKQGRRIYAPKAKAHSSAAPWLIGIGAVVVLALGLVMMSGD